MFDLSDQRGAVLRDPTRESGREDPPIVAIVEPHIAERVGYGLTVLPNTLGIAHELGLSGPFPCRVLGHAHVRKARPIDCRTLIGIGWW